MPCRSDYLEPTNRELDSQEVAKHLIYVSKIIKNKLPENIKNAATDCYGNVKLLDDMVQLLCSMLSSMSEEDINRIVYNAKDKKSRKLADWWETHQVADKKRIKKEAAEKKKIEEDINVLNTTLKKLSKKEIAILKEHFKSQLELGK